MGSAAESVIDVLVVGGGPAGQSAARAAALAGVRVLLIEAKRRLGENPHCAGLIPLLLGREIDIPTRAGIQRTASMEIRIDGRKSLVAAPGLLLDRGRFDYGLAENAAAAGAEIMAATRLVAREDQVWVVRGPDGFNRLRPKITIAADGATSRVRRLLGISVPEFLVGGQLEVPLTAPLDRTIISFDRRWRHGYAWLFPKGQTASLGLGLAADGADLLWKRLVQFRLEVQAAGLIRPGTLSRSVGVIPVSGPIHDLVQGDVIFTGDAAGLTHPITGAGILQAVVSGRSAGQTAADFIKSGDPGVLAAYPREMRDRFGRMLAIAIEKRKLIEEDWDESDFHGLVIRTWPAFKEYHRP